MIYGKWSNGLEYFICRYAYEDFENEFGNSWFGTSLLTSKISDDEYYVYTDIEDNKLVVGYVDKKTEKKTENFLISFNKDSISLFNLNDGESYVLSLDTTFDKIEKGNARLAYIYIANKIFTFLEPSAIKITRCYVDHDKKIVYATVKSPDSYGNYDATDYKFYEKNSSFYMEKCSYDHSTNINLSELNTRLQNYVSTTE